MEWLNKVLPTLATAFGGPLAGVAAAFVADKLGLEDKTVESVTNAITGMKPEQLVQMKAIDADLQKFFAELGIKELTLENADRDSARKREIDVKDGMAPFLAVLVTIGFFGSLGFLVLKGFPADNKEVLIYMLGALQTAWISVIAYYFGSTKSNKDTFKTMTNSLAQSKEK